MSKASITWLFGAAIAAVVAGFVIAVAAVVAALAGGAFVLGGPQVLTVNVDALGGAAVPLVIASLLVATGSVAAIASWIAALRNTSRLDDKTWFVALLVMGLFSLGWVAMIAYVLVGPDGEAQGPALPKTAISRPG